MNKDQAKQVLGALNIGAAKHYDPASDSLYGDAIAIMQAAVDSPDVEHIGKLVVNPYGDSGIGIEFTIDKPEEVLNVGKLVYSAAPQERKSQEADCKWTKDPDFEMGDTYSSACGELWSFIDGGPNENRVRFCQGCGKPMKLAPTGATE